MTAESLAKLLSTLEDQLGPFELVMLLSDTGGSESWELLVSAPALDAMEPSEGAHMITPLLMQTLAEEQWRTIHRVAVLRTGHPLVRTLHAFQVAQPVVQEIFGVTLASIEIPHALVAASAKNWLDQNTRLLGICPSQSIPKKNSGANSGAGLSRKALERRRRFLGRRRT